jgi:hypothetical protein
MSLMVQAIAARWARASDPPSWTDQHIPKPDQLMLLIEPLPGIQWSGLLRMIRAIVVIAVEDIAVGYGMWLTVSVVMD